MTPKDITQLRICIVTPSYLSNTPRVVKEADALHSAGYDVRVVFSQGSLEYAREHDDELLSSRQWQADRIGWSSQRPNERVLYHASRVRHFVMRKIPPIFWSVRTVAEMAEGRVFPELALQASAQRADLFIGHYLDGMAAAAHAARRWNSMLGYDAEDFHSEFGSDEIVKLRASVIEQRYLSACSHITAASELMASALADKYKCFPPKPVHNVFPWADRDHLDGQIKDRRGDALSIYWYSQTIGLDRGIQDAIRAAGLVDGPIQIHLRGSLSDAVRQSLMSLAAECGVGDRLYFHERVAPGELLSRAVEHDIGLAAEPFKDINNGLTVSNKLFLYLLAGLCVAASDVPGQRRVLETIPEAGFLYPVGDYRALASVFQSLVERPDLLQQRKQAALEAARTRWNWELESQKLVKAVGGVFGHADKRSPR